MKLGILSDTHNNVQNTRRALAIFKDQEVERLVHCGDLTRPSVIEEFMGWRVDFVFGNGDYDREDIRATIGAMLKDSTIGDQWIGEIDGVRLAAMHGDNPRGLKELIKSGIYRYVFCGHSHIRLDEWEANTRVINPGSLGGKRSQTRSVCVLDLTTRKAQFIELSD